MKNSAWCVERCNSSRKNFLLVHFQTRNREAETLEYNEALKEKFAHFPKIKRIATQRHLPKHVYHAKREHKTIREGQKRREANARANSKPGSVPYVAERAKLVLKEDE